MAKLPDNSLYCGLEVKDGAKFGIEGLVLILTFNHSGQIFCQIYPFAPHARIDGEMIARIGQICLRETRKDSNVIFEFPENDQGMKGFFLSNVAND